MVLAGNLGRDGDALATVARGVEVIARAIQAPAVGAGLEQHPVPGGARRTIRHAVLDGVDVDAGPQDLREPLHPRSLDDLLDGEVLARGLLPVEERGRD